MCTSFRRASPRLQKRLKRNINMVSKWRGTRLLQFHPSTSFDRSIHRILFVAQPEAGGPHIYPPFDRAPPINLGSTQTWLVLVLRIRKKSSTEISLVHLVDQWRCNILFLHGEQEENHTYTHHSIEHPDNPRIGSNMTSTCRQNKKEKPYWNLIGPFSWSMKVQYFISPWRATMEPTHIPTIR